MPPLAYHASRQPCYHSDCCCLGVCALRQDSTWTATCREFEFVLISEPNLEEMAVMQRLQVNAAIATVQLGYGGKLVVETTDLTAQVFKVRSHSLADTPPPPSTLCNSLQTQMSTSNAVHSQLQCLFWSSCWFLLQVANHHSLQYPVCSLLQVANNISSQSPVPWMQPSAHEHPCYRPHGHWSAAIIDEP